MHRKGFEQKSSKLYWFIQPDYYRSKHECSFFSPYIRGHLLLQCLGCFPGGYGIHRFFHPIFCRLHQIQACFSHFWRLTSIICHGYLRIQSPSTDTKIFTHMFLLERSGDLNHSAVTSTDKIHRAFPPCRLLHYRIRQ